MKTVLVGAGGHAKVLVETIREQGGDVAIYVDANSASWLDIPHRASDRDVAPGDGAIVLGIGGVTPDALDRRLSLFAGYRRRGFDSEPLVHSAAWVSRSAQLGAGSVILAGAIVQPAVKIGDAVIVNSGAIVEHDSIVGDGAHLAPGAIVLGNCRIGRCCMIGAGAVILPGAVVPDRTLVAAATRWPMAAAEAGTTA